MLYEDPVKSIDIENQTLATNSGKLLKYGSLIIATGSTASRYLSVCFGPFRFIDKSCCRKSYLLIILLLDFQIKLGEIYLVFTTSVMLQMLIHSFHHW